MDIDRICSVCPEEAPMFCRMCNLHYCPDHLCLHLNVAWETNTWTRRNNSDSEAAEPDSEGSGVFQQVHRERSYENSAATIQAATKSILSYTETELQAQYNFYLSQARRIRVELERRCLPLASPAESKQKRPVSWERRECNKHKPRKAVPKSATHAVELLLNQMRLGGIRADQVIKGIEIAQMRAGK